MTDSIYTTTASAHGGRAGTVESTDPPLSLQLSLPAAVGGEGGTGTNPEQLFASGYAACFQSALGGVAAARDVDVSASTVSVTISLVGDLTKGVDLAARIEVDLPGVDPDTAQRLINAAHHGCPYSRATRGNIAVELALTGAPGPAA